MLASFLITFREALEAALIIGIIAAYLTKIGRKDLYRYLYMGIIGAVIASTGVALLLNSYTVSLRARQNSCSRHQRHLSLLLSSHT